MDIKTTFSIEDIVCVNYYSDEVINIKTKEKCIDLLVVGPEIDEELKLVWSDVGNIIIIVIGVLLLIISLILIILSRKKEDEE